MKISVLTFDEIPIRVASASRLACKGVSIFFRRGAYFVNKIWPARPCVSSKKTC